MYLWLYIYAQRWRRWSLVWAKSSSCPLGSAGGGRVPAFLFQNKNWKSDFKTTTCEDYHGIVVTIWAELSWWWWSLWSDLWGGDHDNLLKILVWSSDLWSWSDHCHGTWRASRRLRTTRWGSRRWNDHHFDCNYSYLLTNYILRCLQLYCICFDLKLYLYKMYRWGSRRWNDDHFDLTFDIGLQIFFNYSYLLT